jgi:hypothetical protein
VLSELVEFFFLHALPTSVATVVVCPHGFFVALWNLDPVFAFGAGAEALNFGLICRPSQGFGVASECLAVLTPWTAQQPASLRAERR